MSDGTNLRLIEYYANMFIYVYTNTHTDIEIYRSFFK
jgi:hypothetical protein